MADGGAVLSDCGTFRYMLWRDVDPLGRGRGYCLFVMNNPSTADAREDDPTIRRVKGYASAWSYRRVYVANTNPYRATDPKRALMCSEAVLAINDEWLQRLARGAEIVVAAWGAAAEPVLSARALDLLRYVGPVHSLALTKHGHPKHPLYLRRDLRPMLWKERTIVEVA